MNYTISDNRIPLKPGDIIEAGAYKRYIVDKYIASGGFALMYIAHEACSGGNRYVALKELFPRDLENALAQRLEDGKILIWNPFSEDDKGNEAELHAQLQEYFRREVMLTQKAGAVYADNGEVEEQNNLDVLKVDGPFTDAKGNIYLAVDTYMGEPLRSYIERGFVKNSSGRVLSNQLLLEILDILIETTIRLSSLHDGASMYHLDLSPDNIYLAHAAGRTRYQPYIIDYGSAYDRDNPNEQVDHRYTRNSFSAPEIMSLAELGSGCGVDVNESCDTFSLAAILFYAATGCVFTSRMRLFDSEWKEQIQKAYSWGIPSLTRALSFANDLIAFFDRGLAASPKNRYRTAKELLQALRDLRASYQAYGNLLPLVETDELMSYLVLQKHPLYEYKSEDGHVHVMCLGSGRFIKRMILSLISTGQMADSHLYIHIVSKDDVQALRAELCRAAPLLKEYSNILGCCDSEREYVTFTFESVKDVLNEDTCTNIVTGYNSAHYYLISLGKNKQNIEAANLYARAISNTAAANRKTIINYYRSEDAANSFQRFQVEQNISPCVEVDAFAEDLSSYSHTIRELGIRTIRLSHLYNKLSDSKATLNETAKALLEDRYSQRSSCASALHIRYKLAGAGILPDEITDPEKAIADYRLSLTEDTFGKLLELEHRRWLMFMVADQYLLPTEKELIRYGFEQVDGRFNPSWKCTAKKMHPCLVPCNSSGIVLTQDKWQSVFGKEQDPRKIEEAINSSDVDPLDKVSLKLHLLSLIKCRRILSSGRIDQQFAYIADKLNNDLHPSEACEKEKLQKVLDSTRQYILDAVNKLAYFGHDGRLDSLQESFASVSLNVENEIQQIHQYLCVFAEYADHKDYKAFDATFIRNLMWLLYSEDDIALIKLQSDTIVNNIASALLLEPKSITYFGQSPNRELEAFLRGRKFAGTVDFINLKNTCSEVVEERLQAIVAAQSGRCVIDVTGAKEFLIHAAEKIAGRTNSVSLISYDKDNTLKNLRNFPTALAYSLPPYLSADDVFALHGAKRVPAKYNYMEYLEDFVPALWKLYREHQDNWEMITAFFAHTRCSGAGIGVYDFQIDLNTQWAHYFRNDIPVEAWTALQLGPVFCELENSGFIRNVILGESGICKTVTFDYPAANTDPKKDFIRKAFTVFFSTTIPSANTPFTCRVAVSKENKYTVEVKSESVVRCFSKKEDYSDHRQNKSVIEKRYPYTGVLPVLRQLEEMGLISKLNICVSPTAGTIDIGFFYKDLAVKRCLSTTGNILELYVWHHARQTRMFDDCAANFTFQWKEGVQNELDVILTAGLTTLVISCKTAKFNKDHLNEIKCLTEQFSVNSKPVIIYSSTLAVEDGRLTANLQPVKARARAMGIYLIDLNELEEANIPLGEELARIAKGLDRP